MMNETRTIKRGELVLLTAGEYSDYDVKALAKAKADFDIDQMREAYLGQFPEDRKEYSFKVYQFIEWLMKQGVIKELKYREFHIGGYGQADFSLDEY